MVTPADTIAAQLVKLGYLASLSTAGGPGGWNPATHAFADTAAAVYRAYVRQIGAGAVAAGGFITLLKTLPTIVSSFKESVASLRHRHERVDARTERDLPITVVLVGSVILVLVMAVLPFVPGAGIGSKLLLGLLIVVFGFFFVTVASRIVGLIGSSSNPISGMTIATLMGTCLVFVGLALDGRRLPADGAVRGGDRLHRRRERRRRPRRTSRPGSWSAPRRARSRLASSSGW